jgi:pimeloyl-ACP methyl ester carboxylesterase
MLSRDWYGARRARALVIALLAGLILIGPNPVGRDDMAEAAIGHGHVYLLRGLGNVFSLGMDVLGDELAAKGVRESVSNHLTWSSLSDKVIAEYRKNRKTAPIIIVGHSLGGNAALLMADKLGRAGVPVRLLVIFDATDATPVPANVAEAINYYYPGGRGDALVPGPGFKGRIRNDNLKDLPTLKHMNVDESPALHKRVVSRVLGILG